MVRSCHLDTCPVGIATQRPELREKFAATPEMVASYLVYVAEEVRRSLAALGLRSLDDAIGRVGPAPATQRRDEARGRAHSTSCSPAGRNRDGTRASRIWCRPAASSALASPWTPTRRSARPSASSSTTRSRTAIAPIERGSAGGSGGGSAAPRPRACRRALRGRLGQSFGAFLARGARLELVGEANDYVAKGMSGGRISIRPPVNDAGDPVLVGNTALYGATGGELFCAGRAGERFAVRNSGAVAVVEGTGDHACEYMTGGTVVILGETRRNVAAGMTGGELCLHDAGDRLSGRLNEASSPPSAPPRASSKPSASSSPGTCARPTPPEPRRSSPGGTPSWRAGSGSRRGRPCRRASERERPSAASRRPSLGALRRLVADGLDVVAVGVEHVRRVVGRVVLRTHAGSAVVCPARGQRRRVERVHGFAVIALESDVRAADGLSPPDPEVEAVCVREVGEPPRLLVHDPVSERLQRSEIKFFAALKSVTLTCDVREHPASSRGYSRRA